MKYAVVESQRREAGTLRRMSGLRCRYLKEQEVERPTGMLIVPGPDEWAKSVREYQQRQQEKKDMERVPGF